MELTGSVLVALQIASVAVLAVMGLTLWKASQLHSFFSGRPGGALMTVIFGVVLGFTLAQCISVLNILVAIATDDQWFSNGIFLRLLQQILIIVVCVWAWRKMSKIY